MSYEQVRVFAGNGDSRRDGHVGGKTPFQDSLEIKGGSGDSNAAKPKKPQAPLPLIAPAVMVKRLYSRS